MFLFAYILSHLVLSGRSYFSHFVAGGREKLKKCSGTLAVSNESKLLLRVELESKLEIFLLPVQGPDSTEAYSEVGCE